MNSPEPVAAPAAGKWVQRLVLFGIVLMLVLVTVVTVKRIQQKNTPLPVAAPSPLAVAVETVTPQPFQRQRHYRGSVEALERSALSAQITATVEGIAFREGEAVKAGDVLLRLDDRELQDEQRRLTAARQRIQADLEFWTAQRQRQERLIRNGSTSEQLLDEARSRVLSLEASLQENRIAQDTVTTRLSYTRLRAPYAAVVQQLLVERGQLAMPGKVLIELLATTPVRILVAIPQVDLPLLHTGLEAKIRLAGQDEVRAARIRYIYPALAEGTRTATVELRLDEPWPALRPGMAVQAGIIVEQSEAALTVPQQALHDGGVFLVEDNMARWQAVQGGPSWGGRTLIEAGLEAGQQVVVTTDPRLVDGRRLWITPVDTAP